MIYLHGDIHGKVQDILEWMDSLESIGSEKNYLILLGDVGFNFFMNDTDVQKKVIVQKRIDFLRTRGIDLCILCVRGNHECRPSNIDTYERLKTSIGEVYYEVQYPDIQFLMDGGIYCIDRKKFVVLGGGNSNDYFSRILNQEPFWADESYTLEEQNAIWEYLRKNVQEHVAVLAHVLPKSQSIRPKGSEAGLSVETFAEEILDVLQGKITDWYCGHYHVDMNFEADNVGYHIMYKRFIAIE